MAAITKSSVKARSRGFSAKTSIYCVVAITVCFLLLNQGFLIESEKYEISPILSINEKPKSDGAVVKTQSVPSSSSTLQLKEVGELQPTNLSFPKSNEDNFRNPSVSLGKKVYMYHHTQSSGKEGAVVLDMLLGHVYAFHQGAIYGGSCGEGNDVGREPENSLIRAVGLQDFLQFACPRDLETTDRKRVIPGRSYIQDGTRAFTPEYIDILKSVMRFPKKQENQKKTNIIVVHMSRGKKFTPCRKALHKEFEAYLPNKHYQVRKCLQNSNDNSGYILYC